MENDSEKNITTDVVASENPLKSFPQNDRDGDSIHQKALVRRIDYRIVPLMFCCYLMQFLDKVLINVSFQSHMQSHLEGEKKYESILLNFESMPTSWDLPKTPS